MVSVTPLFHAFIDFLFPPVCLSCSELLQDRDAFLCPDCTSKISRLDRDGEFFLDTLGALTSGGKIADVLVPFVFEKGSPLQNVIHAVKYQGMSQPAEWLGRLLGAEVQRLGTKADLIIPVPLHKARERERGYNQAEVIARGVCSVVGAEEGGDVLRRVRNTSTQTKLSADERKKNMEEAFVVNPRRVQMVEGKVILLVDDVLTTGATLKACAEPLIKEGASAIVVGTVALAEKKR